MKGLPKYCQAPTLMEQMTLWDRASAMVAKGPYVGQLIYHCRYSGGAFLMEICGVGNGRANNKSMRIAEVGVINTENALGKYQPRKFQYSKNLWIVDNRAYPDMALDKHSHKCQTWRHWTTIGEGDCWSKIREKNRINVETSLRLGPSHVVRSIWSVYDL